MFKDGIFSIIWVGKFSSWFILLELKTYIQVANQLQKICRMYHEITRNEAKDKQP